MLPPMSIVIVRHGQTPLNAARILQTPDTPLSELGMEQARRLAPRLRELGVVRVLCSDYPRAQMTAAPFAEQSGVVPELHEVLRERHFGELRGRPYAEVPLAFDREYAPPGGESWSVFELRVAEAWALVTREAAVTEGVLAVVTHGLVCLSVLRRHLHLPEHINEPTGFSNASVTLVDRAAPYVVQIVNDVRHLD